MVCDKEGSERNQGPCALKGSYHGHMMLDFRVQTCEQKLTTQATIWAKKISIPKLRARAMMEKVMVCDKEGKERHK